MIDDLDKKIISLIQGDLPLDARPFAVLAEKLGASEPAVIERIRGLRRRGILRRFGATLRHQEAGFSANAMVAWRVPEDRVDRVGRRLAEFRQVTHCYQRRPARDWPYTVYSMIHGDSPEKCREIAAAMARTVGVDEYRLLFSEREFKKTSMRYFEIEDRN